MTARAFWGTWRAVPFFLAYGVLYGSFMLPVYGLTQIYRAREDRYYATDGHTAPLKAR
ncbi:MAG: hypothetical protein M3Y33_04290 [Actinomycetota bacterium]|nr:hypothetical protein [Actinomycetota bacterium]